MSGKASKKLKQTRTRAWLLCLFAVVLVVSAGTLIYKIVDAVVGGTDISSGEIVNYNGKGDSAIDGSDYYAAIERKHDFNDSWSGRESGGVVEWVMSDVIAHNKKYPDEPIQVIFGNMNCGSNTNCITEEKKKLADMNDYEISYEYNDEGSVYMVRISSGPANYFLLIPLVMTTAIVVFMIFGIIKSNRTRKKITKKIIDSMEEGMDGFKY